MGTHIVSELEPTYAAGRSTDVPLGEFLKRPVEIFSRQVALNEDVSVIQDPWRDFLNDAAVKRRLEGFKHLRGHLKIRATITGNPFLYGRFIVAYEPRQALSIHPKAAQLSECFRMQLTQLPHIFLDPSKGEGGEMTFPFFCPENWIDLTHTTSVSDMGRVYIHTFNRLKHANATTGSCVVRIYAWMEDAELCTPTADGYGTWGPIQAQSEFAEHPISNVASAIERAAGALSVVPMFRPFAKATEMAAGMAGSVAKAFGFSRPAVLDNIVPYKAFAVGNMAVTNAHEAITPIGIDVKRELTIDPRTVGLPAVDEMAISYICGKESFIHDEPWADTDELDAVLFSVNVTPQHFETDSTTTPWRSCLTPAAYVGMLFNYWRGTVIYRFQIVASALHRGKLRVTYEPATANTPGKVNEVYSRIIDIEECRDFEIPVQWHARTPWLKLENLDLGTTSFNKGSGSGLATLPDFHNGKLFISVMNPLVSPDPALGLSITINCFARMGDDFQYNLPADTLATEQWSIRSTNVSVQPQSAMEADGLPQDNNPVGGEPIAPIGDVSIVRSDQTDLVFFGENIPSLRTLLRRYAYSGAVTGVALYKTRQDITTDKFPIREYILAMYAGWRGSVRVKYAALINAPAFAMASGNPRGLNYLVTNSMMGVVANAGTLETEFPYYYNRRFSHARTHPSFAANTDTDLDDPNGDQYSHLMYGHNGNAFFDSIGEDFTCFFFLGTPLLHAKA
jgi:hypothetical protein